MIRNADELCPNVSRVWQIAGNPRAHHFPTPTGALPRNGDRGTFVALMLFFVCFPFLLGLRDLRFNTLFSVWSFTQRIPEMEVQKKFPPPARPGELSKKNRTGPARRTGPVWPGKNNRPGEAKMVRLKQEVTTSTTPDIQVHTPQTPQIRRYITVRVR